MSKLFNNTAPGLLETVKIQKGYKYKNMPVIVNDLKIKEKCDYDYTMYTCTETENYLNNKKKQCVNEKKRFLYIIAATFLIPIVLVGFVLYKVLYVVQLLFRTINLQLEKGMNWIDKNITDNM